MSFFFPLQAQLVTSPASLPTHIVKGQPVAPTLNTVPEQTFYYQQASRPGGTFKLTSVANLVTKKKSRHLCGTLVACFTTCLKMNLSRLYTVSLNIPSGCHQDCYPTKHFRSLQVAYDPSRTIDLWSGGWVGWGRLELPSQIIIPPRQERKCDTTFFFFFLNNPLHLPSSRPRSPLPLPAFPPRWWTGSPWPRC